MYVAQLPDSTDPECKILSVFGPQQDNDDSARLVRESTFMTLDCGQFTLPRVSIAVLETLTLMVLALVPRCDWLEMA